MGQEDHAHRLWYLLTGTRKHCEVFIRICRAQFFQCKIKCVWFAVKTWATLNIPHPSKRKLCTWHFTDHMIKPCGLFSLNKCKKAPWISMFWKSGNLFRNGLEILDPIWILLKLFYNIQLFWNTYPYLNFYGMQIFCTRCLFRNVLSWN